MGGYKVKGATGTGLECGKDLTVSATAYCEKSACAAGDAGTCCQQKCDKGFKASGATTNEANTCPKDQKVSTDGKCAGSPCNSAKDEGTCCNMKCNDEKEGFKNPGIKQARPRSLAQQVKRLMPPSI